MVPVFKPYRLINTLELTTLQQQVESRLQNWNNTHAMFPLTCRLGLAPTTFDHCWAKAQPTRLSVIKHSLFGDESPCFNASADTLFAGLLHDLFGTQLPNPIEDWFYIGTPSLTLTLYCGEKKAILYLDPQWVLTALPSKPPIKKTVSTLHQALAKQRIHLTVELTPFPLKLADILRLDIGDVIKTDHPITEPAYLSHQKQRICEVDIGESNSFKTIKTTRIT